MEQILEQLGLDRTFFFQFVIVLVLFFLLSKIYFKPFLKLFEARHKRTVEDREAAEKLVAQAQAKLEEYTKRLSEERQGARKEYDAVLLEAKREELMLLTQARDEAKKLTQGTLESIVKQRDQIKKELEADVDSLAKTLSDKLLVRKE